MKTLSPLPLATPEAPAELRALQTWFAQAVTLPASTDKAQAAARLSDQYLTASQTMSPRERLDVYVSDYWSRCMDSLAEDFPGLLHLLGGKLAFQGYLEKYLMAYPSRTYTLYHLGEKLHEFMLQNYREPNRDMVLDDIAYEWARVWALIAPTSTPFDPAPFSPAQQSKLAEIPLTFQPSVTLLELGCDVRPLRLAKENPALPPPQKTALIVYRQNHNVCNMLIDPSFLTLLKMLQSGKTLSEASPLTAALLTPKQSAKLLKQVSNWFQTAVSEGWLSQPVF